MTDRDELIEEFTLTDPTPPKVTERHMLDHLMRRYDKPLVMGTSARFVRAEHVPNALSLRYSAIADFVAVDMHSASSGYNVPASEHWRIEAPVIHGHEVKVSRSDWLTELRKPWKSEAWRRHCHFWWLVVSDKSIVRDDLPEGWGLMVRSGGMVRVAVQAPVNVDAEPMPAQMLGALLRASVKTETTPPHSTSRGTSS